ncbi:cold shock domain-containing protein [Streptomyces scopuliridis]|uniref:DNA-binding protein n=2 Tax=Streptomyces scopuliridis TaxID=452529 RepID=A0A2T7SXJ7_9ACTN|nr:cold shock domain-containing protein [Streptomyces scopuliridis]PVE07584.1 DNA-binding protein [Streptomyces scopuliridis RB72]WSB37050.1 cold shock domain-containing protein [Streptomyces scopuliridis]WSC01446.1 cold shock domain-containing protein [Streptomyces scopuliridis]WSC05017.1 cold shock domain-containing protein [Streptomyces scopuliridis]
MLKTGKIQRFDETRGYGFINPDEGGEDVFMHANDLLDEKYLYQAGRDVEFFVEMGEKGPKASEIRLIHQPSRRRPEQFGADSGAAEDEPGAAGFRSELTDVLLDADGTLTADQIKRIRTRIVELARARGWISD